MLRNWKIVQSIAQKFTFGKTKASYNITHGLAPYFHDLVYNSVVQSDYIVACFDESLNEVAQKGQMDLCIRYWEKSLLDRGSCGLHVVHGTFQNGHKNAKWNVNTALRSFYKLFHDSPARQADYQKINDSSVFPMKFCTTRWVENVKPAQRALDIYENIQKYVKNSKLPNNFTINSVDDSVDDILMPVRILFFHYVASIIEPFLKFFQSDKPLSSFLYQELEKIIYSLLEKFIKPEVLAVNKSVFKMMKLDLNANRVHYKNVKIGIVTTSLQSSTN